MRPPDPDDETVTAILRDDAPTTRSMFGERLVVPEFVTASCDVCGASGALHEDTALRADRIVCPECAEGEDA